MLWSDDQFVWKHKFGIKKKKKNPISHYRSNKSIVNGNCLAMIGRYIHILYTLHYRWRSSFSFEQWRAYINVFFSWRELAKKRRTPRHNQITSDDLSFRNARVYQFITTALYNIFNFVKTIIFYFILFFTSLVSGSYRGKYSRSRLYIYIHIIYATIINMYIYNYIDTRFPTNLIYSAE